MNKNRIKGCLAVIVAACVLPAQAEEIILNGDGTEIRLKDDGSWERVSDNIYLDTSEGRRVVLKPDGSWSYVGLAPVAAEDHYRELLVEVAIKSALIKETREKVGSKKNVRSESFTYYDLTVSVAATAAGALALAELDPAWFNVSDNRGNQFEVVAVNSSSQTVAPGQSAQLQLVCEGAPSGFARSKTLTITIDQQAFATERAVQLEISYDDIQRQRINL